MSFSNETGHCCCVTKLYGWTLFGHKYNYPNESAKIRNTKIAYITLLDIKHGKCRENLIK